MRKRLARLPLLWKIFLSTSVAVSALFAVTAQIMMRDISATISAGLEEEVRAGFQAYTSLWNARAEMLSSVSRILSEMSDVRAAFGTGDQATIRDSAGDLWARVSDATALFLVTDGRGRVIASLGGPARLARSRDLELVRAASARFPRQASGFFLDEGDLYQLSVTPVYVQSGQEPVLINVLVAGYPVDALVAQKLRDETGGSEFLFLTPDRVIASTLNPRATAAVVAHVRRGGGSEVSDGLTRYAYFRKPLLDVEGRPAGEIFILRSFAAADRRIRALFANIVLLWLAAMSMGLALSYLLARRIVEPVKRLDRAAAEVARRNYEIEVAAEGEDEIGRLARTFNQMCASIRHARDDLIRQERIATIGRLSSSIVHDLRNPLAAIYGGAEILVDSDLPPDQVKRLANNIYGASRRIQELLKDLLDVSRGRTRAPELARLREMAAAASDTLVEAARASGVRVEISIPPELEVPVDRGRMERTFVNLIGNAIEAMPEGGEVRVSAARVNGSALVEVADTGPGIAAGIRDRLFQPFVTSGKRNGLGLGLALSRQAILDHGGDLWVESSPGTGARFRFRLPGAQ
jgi:signal transduction histidine kinase